VTSVVAFVHALQIHLNIVRLCSIDAKLVYLYILHTDLVGNAHGTVDDMVQFLGERDVLVRGCPDTRLWYGGWRSSGAFPRM
jgi:hypothetical protein